MKHFFQINVKLIILCLIFIFAFAGVNLGLIHITLNESIELTAEVYYDQIKDQLTKELQLLKLTTEKIASNNEIIKLLEENPSLDLVSAEEKAALMEQINLYEQNLESSSFVDTVNIVSFTGDYLFSKGKIYDNFVLNRRPWFHSHYLNTDTPIIITDLHKDFNTNDLTIAMVAFIYSSDGSELLGAAILDIYINKLLASLQANFRFGQLRAQVLPKDVPPSDVLPDVSLERYAIKHADDILHNGNGIVFLFDKASIRENTIVKPLLLYTKLMVAILGLFLFIGLILSIRKHFIKPTLLSIDKLKYLLEQLDDKNPHTTLSHLDEFKQLEVLSFTLGKSFDNKIQSLIYHDALTGLPNRKKMTLICSELIAAHTPFALVFIDLNKFKKVNDIFGHSIGDQLLIVFSKTLEQLLGDAGVCVRYSGDEFIIIYKNYTDDASFLDFYNTTIVPAFSKPLLICDELTLSIEFAAGIAVYPKDGLTLEDLINKSDFMMYTSKNVAHPYQLFFFNQTIYKDMLYIETLKNELKHAIENNELTLHYQPIFDSSKHIAKAEALIRFNSRALGSVSPTQFIHCAEETRLIIPIGYWIIEQVCRFINTHHIPVPIGINVSPIQLLDLELVQKVEDYLSTYSICPQQLYFEITESVLLDDSDIVSTNLLNLRALGICIALDDFGTGYASFNYLKNYTLDFLKIDKLFLSNASDNDFKIIGHIKEICHLLHMEVVIEGVETEAQFNQLKTMGFKFFQGYYLSKPLDEHLFLTYF